VHAARGFLLERRVEREDGGVGGEDVVALRVAERARAPQPEVQQDVVQFAAVLGELVDQAGVELRQDAAADDAGLLQLVEPGRQDARRDAGQASLQVREALRAEDQVAED
jgi:hypothetical protein